MEIYSKQKINTGQLRTSGHYTDVLDVQTYKRLNSNYELSFLIPMNSSKYSLIEEEGLIDCEGQKYVIKSKKRNRQGMGRTVQINCQHVFNRLRDIRIPAESALDESLGGNMSTFTALITAATSGVFTFQFMETIPVKDVYKWGYSNCLKAFQDLVNTYQVEFIPDNYNIKIYNKISIDDGLQYRYGKNILSSNYETNTDALVTRMTGLAKDSLTIIGLASTHLTAGELALLTAAGGISAGLITVPYLISQYAASWATPDNAYFDGDFENNDIEADDEAGKLLLLAEIRKKLVQHEVPDIQVQIKAADLWKIKPRERQPQIGEIVYLTDTEMEVDDIQTRVMEIREWPFDPSKDSDVTVANFLLRDSNQIIAELNASKNLLDRLLTNGKVNTSAFEAFAAQAVIDINNSKTEIVYDARGIVLQDQLDALNQVIMTANGIIVTEDGGATANVAITGAGVSAAYIVGILGEFAQVKTDNIIAGVATISTALIDALVVGGNVSIGSAQDAAGVTSIIGGTVTTSFVNALNVTANSVNAAWVYAGTLTAAQVNAVAISASSISTGTLSAAYINTSGLAAEKIYKPGSPNNYVVVGGTFSDMILYYNSSVLFKVYNNLGGISLYAETNPFISANSIGAYPQGAWDFSSATITGLSVTAKFA